MSLSEDLSRTTLENGLEYSITIKKLNFKHLLFCLSETENFRIGPHALLNLANYILILMTLKASWEDIRVIEETLNKKIIHYLQCICQEMKSTSLIFKLLFIDKS